MIDLYSLFRPSSFNEVIGHSSIVNFLLSSIVKNIVPSFMVFYGSYGVGKTTLARIYAKSINCSNYNDSIGACNTCDACVNLESYIFEFNASNYTKIDDVRSLFGSISSKPLYGTYKFYILDEFNMLSSKSLHLLLKEVEEPYKHVRYIAIANNIESVIPSLLSRAMLFRFDSIGPEYSNVIVDYILRVVRSNSLRCDIDQLTSHVLKVCSRLPEISCRCVINSAIRFLVSDINTAEYAADNNVYNVCITLFLSHNIDLSSKYEIINRFYSGNGSPYLLISTTIQIIVKWVFESNIGLGLKKRYCLIGNVLIREHDLAIKNKSNMSIIVGVVHMLLNNI